METKVCTKCEILKEISLFSSITKTNKKGETYTYVNTWCRKCKNKYKEEYLNRPENAEKKLEKMRRASKNKTNRFMNDSEYAERKNEYRKNWYKQNKEKLVANKDIRTKEGYYRNNYLKNTYGLTLGEYNEICNQQENKCLICDTPNNLLVVDHDHSNGDIRGLLCPLCNMGLGNFNDSIENLKRAILYLQKEPMIKNVD